MTSHEILLEQLRRYWQCVLILRQYDIDRCDACIMDVCDRVLAEFQQLNDLVSNRSCCLGHIDTLLPRQRWRWLVQKFVTVYPPIDTLFMRTRNECYKCCEEIEFRQDYPGLSPSDRLFCKDVEQGVTDDFEAAGDKEDAE